MRYLVFGYIGFDNFGDEMIANCLVRRLKDEGAKNITLISSNPKKTSDLYGVEACGMLNFFPYLLKSDALISGGGSLLQDTTSLKSLVYYLGVISLALIFGKNVELCAQGIGPLKSKIGQFLTKFVLKRVHYISVRDKKSYELLKSWGVQTDLVKDSVLTADLHLEEVSKADKQGIGVQLRDFTGVDEEFLLNLAEELARRFNGKNIKIISLQDSADLAICKHFAELLKAKNIISEVLSGLNVSEVIETISKLEYLIAMRFHANVIGLRTGVKTLAINYDPKVKALAEEYNLPIINLDDKDFSKAFDKLLA